jgi:predicted nucleic-acid-binding protein
MLGVDTNVLVRYLTRDDKSQYERARRRIDLELVKGEPVLVSLLVLLETEWVLRSRYKLAKEDIVTAFSALLDTADLALEDEPSIENAVYSWKDSWLRPTSKMGTKAKNAKIGLLTNSFSLSPFNMQSMIFSILRPNNRTGTVQDRSIGKPRFHEGSIRCAAHCASEPNTNTRVWSLIEGFKRLMR